MVFQWLDGLWGPHSIDRFSSPENGQIELLNSRFWALGTEAVDAFTSAWDEENNWWVPPLHLIPRVIRHAWSTKAKGTLIIPQWVSSPFWPLLFTDGVDPAGFIVTWTELPLIDELSSKILPVHTHTRTARTHSSVCTCVYASECAHTCVCVQVEFLNINVKTVVY